MYFTKNNLIKRNFMMGYIHKEYIPHSHFMTIYEKRNILSGNVVQQINFKKLTKTVYSTLYRFNYDVDNIKCRFYSNNSKILELKFNDEFSIIIKEDLYNISVNGVATPKYYRENKEYIQLVFIRLLDMYKGKGD